MPNRSLYILLFFVVLISGATGWFIDARYQSSAAWQAPQRGLVFPALEHQLNNITDIEVVRASGKFILSKRDGVWLNSGVGGFPALTTKVEKAIVAIASLKYQEAKTRRKSLYTKLDVENINAAAKSTQLTFKESSGKIVADLIIGKNKKILDQRGLYIRLANTEQAWLVESAINNELVDVRHDAIDWSNKRVVDIAPSALTALSFNQESGAILALYRAQPQAAKLTVKNLPVNAKIEHQFQIDYLSGLLNELTFLDAKPNILAQQNSLPAFTIEAKTAYGSAITLTVHQPLADGSAWTQVEAKLINPAQSSTRAQLEVTRISSSFNGWLIKLPRKFTDRLKIKLSDILHQHGAINNE